MTPQEEDLSVSTAWTLPNGSILCVDTKFSDLLGKGPAECVGRPFVSLMVEPVSLWTLFSAAVYLPAVCTVWYPARQQYE